MTRDDLIEKFGAPMKVLDHGHVRLVDLMGDDAAIVQAARVSYGAGVTKRTEDRGLVRYLMWHRHSTPFEMCEIKLHVKLPVFVARQWVRHRTASLNEVSGRYSVLPAEFYVPTAEQTCGQAKKNKQGRAEPLDAVENQMCRSFLEMDAAQAFQHYEAMIERYDLAKETARMALPVSMYTEWYWKIDLHNLMHFLSLRMDEHAQWEIRVYANLIGEIVKAWCPDAWEAFVDYRLEATVLSRMEKLFVRGLVADYLDEGEGDLPEPRVTKLRRMLDSFGLSKREIDEFVTRFAPEDPKIG